MNGSVPFLCQVFAQHMGGRSKLSSSAVGRIHPYPDGRRRSAIPPYGARRGAKDNLCYAKMVGSEKEGDIAGPNASSSAPF